MSAVSDKIAELLNRLPEDENEEVATMVLQQCTEEQALGAIRATHPTLVEGGAS